MEGRGALGCHHGPSDQRDCDGDLVTGQIFRAADRCAGCNERICTQCNPKITQLGKGSLALAMALWGRLVYQFHADTNLHPDPVLSKRIRGGRSDGGVVCDCEYGGRFIELMDKSACQQDGASGER